MVQKVDKNLLQQPAFDGKISIMVFGRKKSKKIVNSTSLPTISENEQKTPPFRQIQVSVSAFLETISDKKKMDLRIPHFILHDFADQEESKIIRMMFSHAKMPFEDKIVHRDDYILEDYPFYSLPMLEIDGRKLGSVPSICRQLGWRYELSGQTARDDSEVDMIGEKIFEVRIRLKNWLDHIEYRDEHECDASCQQSTATYILHSLCLMIENILERSKSPWLVGYKMTWCDLMAACLFNPIIYHLPQLFDFYPNVYLHTKKIAELPQFTGFLYHVKDRKI